MIQALLAKFRAKSIALRLFAFLAISLSVPQLVWGEAKPTIKIGALLSFSGGLEQWCSYIRQGIELAASDTNLVKVDVTFEDDRSFDKQATLAAAMRLAQIKNVDLLYTWSASPAPLLAPFAAKHQLPLLVGAYDENVAKGGPYVFGAFVNYDLVPREIARFLVTNKGARRLAVVTATDDWSQSFEKPFREEIEKLGGSLLLAENITAHETDVKSVIVRLKSKKIDAVLAPLYADSLYSFLKQAKDLRFGGIIHVGDGMFEEDLKVAGPSAEGVFASQIWSESKELADAFKEKFGSESNGLHLGLVASGYDWVRHLQGASAAIVARGKTISRETLQKTLHDFRSEGVLGPQMYGAPPVQSGERIFVVKAGRYEQVEQ